MVTNHPMPDGPEVTLEDVLSARERRALCQQALREAHGGATLISFCMNIPGPVKRFALCDRGFETGRELIARQIARGGWSVLACEALGGAAGCEMLWAVEADPMAVKAALSAVEEGHPLGRLLDIDVIGPDGEKIERTALGLPPRGCLICGAEGPGCARSRAHPVEELVSRTCAILGGYFVDTYVDHIAETALRALLYEVAVTPKPGLVDRWDSGSHGDMDFFTFLDSSAALVGYFRDIARLGLRHRDRPAGELLRHLRFAGLGAEDRMMAATGGVNTHKGAVFSLGILCAACGYLYDTPRQGDRAAVLEVCGQIAAPSVAGDLSGVSAGSAGTSGEAAYAEHRITGVRGEVAGGFPSVCRWALPVIERQTQAGMSLNDAAVTALLHLIAHVDDTNIIGRSDLGTLRAVQGEIAELIATAPDEAAVVAGATGLNRRFIELGISPGGCADLLAVALMLHFLAA